MNDCVLNRSDFTSLEQYIDLWVSSEDKDFFEMVEDMRSEGTSETEILDVVIQSHNETILIDYS